jgi:uncharacterized protein YlxW (UPF0749 family)
MRLFELEEQTTVGTPGATVTPATASPTNAGTPVAGQPLANPEQTRNYRETLQNNVNAAQKKLDAARKAVITAQQELDAAKKVLASYKPTPANRVP